MAGLTPRYPGCPAGPAMQHPGDALRPEFRTQNGSGPHLLQGEHDKSGLFWGPCSRLGHRGPLPQSPLACFFLCKMRLRCLSVRTTVFFIFRTLCNVATYSLSKPRYSSQIHCSRRSGPDRSAQTEYPLLLGSQEAAAAAPGSLSCESHFTTAGWDSTRAERKSQGPAHRPPPSAGAGPCLGA